MAERQIDSGSIAFQTEGRLLQELGERLVASPQIALVELVKNSYDADAKTCTVSLANRNRSLTVADDGIGMNYDQFANRWMRIATSGKVLERVSPAYKRRLTGQKGIGRFAVRFLGKTLELSSIAYDPGRKYKTHLIASFDWTQLDQEQNLDHATIPYKLFRAEEDAETGTTLTIGGLRIGAEETQSSPFRTAVLKIVTPLQGLNGGRFRTNVSDDGGKRKDPGFQVILPGEDIASSDNLDLAKQVLDRAWATLTINFENDVLTYTATFSNDEKPVRLRCKRKSLIRNGFVADIRYFPRRAGVFRGGEVDGQKAWAWVRENSGVAVIDHGFRIPPYGQQDDDWLAIDADNAHNSRAWRSSISDALFPIAAENLNSGENPMLILPTNYQLVGAVFVESTPVGSRTDGDLITAMDRQGFLYNDAFEQFVDFVRGGIEFLAKEDRASLQRAAERDAKAAARQTREDFKEAIKFIEDSPTIPKAEKTRLVKEYSGLTTKLQEVEDYDRVARQRLQAMSALGIVAGFMTHEASRIFASLGDILPELKRLARNHPTIRQDIEKFQKAYQALEGHIEYTRTFIDATQSGRAAVFKAAGQVELVIERFGEFARSRNITVENEIDRGLDAPRMPVAVYSGILLNLYTNALKAILAVASPQTRQRIVFRAQNEGRMHIIDVLDTGIGIPPNMRDRVFDPLFTTTSSADNPLGSGMGLGLSLVKSLVDSLKGKIGIVNPPQGFSTAFRVQLPLR
jgi:signal transduction histidine kinase